MSVASSGKISSYSGRGLSALLMFLCSLVLLGGTLLVEAAACTRKAASLDLAGSMPWESLGIILGSFWLGWLFTVFRRNADTLLLPLAFALSSLGWVEILRLADPIDMPGIPFKQALWLALGVLAFVLVVWGLRDYRALQDYKYTFLLGGVVMQLAVMFFGVESNGARLWFEIGPVRFQPIEFVKILVLVFLAAFLRQFRYWLRLNVSSSSGRLPRKALALLGMGMAVAEILFVIQKDLGVALLLFGVFTAMFYVATGRRDIITMGTVMTAVCAWFCYRYYDHVRTRVQVWLDPFADYYDKGFQMCNGLFAIGNGGLDGSGLGLGSPFYVLEVHTDFIFTALAEELGLLGCAALVMLLMMLVLRAFSIALVARDEFGTILAAGLASLLSWQSLIILMGTTKICPMTGITLPFVSYGGSSVLSCFIVLGLLWNIDHFDALEASGEAHGAEGDKA